MTAGSAAKTASRAGSGSSCLGRAKTFATACEAMIAKPASRTGEAKSHIARAGDSRASASDTMHPCSTMLALISASVRSSTFATAFELTATDRKWLHRWLQPGYPSQAQLSLSRLARSTVRSEEHTSELQS